MKVSVFRVETQRGGCGPYVKSEHYDTLADMFEAHEDAEHPSPKKDPYLEYIADDEYCGFSTVEALDDWFDGYHDVLAECGYVIAVYSVPYTDVRYGSQQCLFRRGDAVPSRVMPML